MDDVDLVLFDLGGVLMQLRGVDEMRRMAALDSDDAVWTQWLTCRWVRSFERGMCTVEEFVDGIVEDWGLAATAEEFHAYFASLPVGVYEGAAGLVAEVRERTAVGCLSNSNALHWTSQIEWGMAEWFDHVFLSHQLGLIKPDREVFDHVAAATGVEPARILFLDDNVMNVDAASAAGFQASVVRGVGETRDTLRSMGVVDRRGG